MTLTLTLSPETEAKLAERAQAIGKTPEAVVLDAIDESLAAEGGVPSSLPVSERLRQFDDWVKSHQSHNPTFDDSRESIYPDRW
jgi:hypothetical protein